MNHANHQIVVAAGGGTRTRTPLRAPDFESASPLRNGQRLASFDVVTRAGLMSSDGVWRNGKSQALSQIRPTRAALLVGVLTAARAHRGQP